MLNIEEIVSPLELIPNIGTPEPVQKIDGKLIIHPELIVMTDSDGRVISRYKDDIWDTTHAGTQQKIIFSDKDLKSKETIKRLVLAFLIRADTVIMEYDKIQNQKNNNFNSAKQAHSYNAQINGIYNRQARGNRTLEELLNDKEALKHCIMETPASAAKSLKITLEMIEFVAESVDIVFVLDEEIENNLITKALNHNKIQYPVIPLPIYGELFRQRWAHFEVVEPFINNLNKFIKRHVSDPFFGRIQAVQEDGTYSVKTLSFPKAFKKYGLTPLFNHYGITNKTQFATFITDFNGTCAYILNQMSGMRINEIKKICHGSFIPATQKRPPLISALTSKMNGGIDRPQDWIVHQDAERVINALEAISIAMLEDITLQKNDAKPIFIKPSYLSIKKRKIALHYNHKLIAELRAERELALDNSHGKLTLTQEYVDVYLKKTELTPEYWDNEGFELIGKQWKSSTHQGRRTYSYLAINSGLVTVSVLKKQLAQSSMLAAAYYGNGASNLDPLVTDGKGHLTDTIEKMRDEQATLTLHAYMMRGGRVDLKKEVTDMDRDETRMDDNNPSAFVFDWKATQKDFKKGNISVVGTLTGWCDKLGPCMSNLFLMFTDCEECKNSHPELERIEENLEVTEEYIKKNNDKGFTEKDLIIIEAKGMQSYLIRQKEKLLKEADSE